jgi:hypothetical protein
MKKQILLGTKNQAKMHIIQTALESLPDEEVLDYYVGELDKVGGESVGTWGSIMANFAGLAGARHALLQREGWDVEKQGSFGAPPIKVVGDIVKCCGSVSKVRIPRAHTLLTNHLCCLQRKLTLPV